MSREYRFDRYRKGRKMAEGLVLTKPTTVEQAMETVYLLAVPSDTFVLREDLARLAAVEAKRDAARAEVAHMKREQQAMIMQHRHDIRDLGELLQDERCKVATVEAERDRAQAGEARAVEALRRCHEGAARQLAEPRDHDDDQYALTAIATDCEAVLADSANALDWLAQQRREAAAEALEKLATDLGQVPWGSALHDVDWLRGILRARAAEIRAGEVGDE